MISSGQIFELGFFSSGNNNSRYLYIASQNNPLTDAYAIFITSNNGTLILLNQRNDTIWYLNSSRAAQTPVAQLLDSGNYVVIDNVTSSSQSYLWKSFDLGSKGQLLIYVFWPFLWQFFLQPSSSVGCAWEKPKQKVCICYIKLTRIYIFFLLLFLPFLFY